MSRGPCVTKASKWRQFRGATDANLLKRLPLYGSYYLLPGRVCLCLFVFSVNAKDLVGRTPVTGVLFLSRVVIGLIRCGLPAS